ncbi:MAG: CRISPR-associated helicase Cas3' [Akkermansiaceae bacterium]|nr:CRISPR-associated helicase Cas3' [Akkermansiaceae bacterium]
MAPNHGHLNKVAYWSGRFAAAMFPSDTPEFTTAHQWGTLAGLWHDLGKFAPEWQEYLKSKADPHSADVSGKVDHSTAGAIFTQPLKPCGELLSYLIAGHHAGLADGTTLFHERFRRSVHEWRPYAEAAGVTLDASCPCPPLTRPGATSSDMAFMLRYFYSCLVDADFLATEAFMTPGQFSLRPKWPDDIIDRMIEALETYLVRKFGNAPPTLVNQARESVRHACLVTAEKSPGFFSLTVPTGGGKTLSSLLFALRHAKKNGLRRAVFVIPFTSIIKQNADVFREVFADISHNIGREIVLEHHSKFEPKQSGETTANRLASENWDAPLIVTTNVRFFESLFANRSSACRKLHRTARSVIVFDEVQALPSHLLAPILSGLRSLVKDLGSTAVLCTATQPALEKRDGFSIGIPPAEITPIIGDEQALFDVLERVESRRLESKDDEALIAHILQHASHGCLVIVNTTKAAQSLHHQLSQHTEALHLSARMCPAHVVSVLDQAKHLRSSGKPVVLVSTQIIEAGVDISFPTVYRAECGLDSFAQAAGRCNRNGELTDSEGQSIPGKVFLFQPSDHPIPKALSDLVSAAAITRSQILPNFPNEKLLSLPAIRSYFEQAIWQAGPRTRNWDKPEIVSGDMPCFGPRTPPQSYDFKRAARDFRLIPSETHAILIPWGAMGKALAEEIRDRDRFKLPPLGEHYRRAQQFTVQVYDHEWQQLKNRVSLHCDEAFAILIHPENDYHPLTGLKRPDSPDDPNAFCL